MTSLALLLLSFSVSPSTVSALPSGGDTQLQSRQDIQSQALDLHNNARAQFGASPLTWNGGILGQVQAHANKCVFEHSGDSGVGENIAAGTGNFGMSNAMDSWMGEASKYDYNNPGFSDATGHFTQVVWKSTTQVACAIASCGANTIFSDPSHFVVCQYTPPGNFAGQFPQNVGRPVN
ncbi:PR-1-like protein [Dendrothele bispora CBS 962.96]|uniref:PR-1-like protein n=1 Tax=Dendrothele bispora (strain CBS 962.96) TaxID=1314807 RepID=A0A4V4HEV9_DENBC|nr:PR-1-like protein [Dendrothele bispora CBS 962.96]